MQPSASRAGRWLAIVLVLSLVVAVIASAVWALSGQRTQWARDLKARFGEVEAARDAREAERAARRQAVRDEVIAAVGSLAAASSDLDEVLRVRGAAQLLALMSAEHYAPPDAPRSGPSLLATQPRFDLLPPRDHAEREAVLTDKLAVMEGVTATRATPEADAFAYLAYLRLHRDDLEGAVAAATRALDVSPTMWLAWVVRGQARLAAGDLAGADADLLLGDALCPKDASWALLARADLAEARGDLALARDLCREALPHVPARYGHADALKARLARLEAGGPR